MGKIIFKPGRWIAYPALLSKHRHEMNGPELSLYLTLCEIARGQRKILSYSNDRLMQKTGIKRQQTFSSARMTLMKKHGVIRFMQSDKQGKVCSYEILDKQLTEIERQVASPRMRLIGPDDQTDTWGQETSEPKTRKTSAPVVAPAQAAQPPIKRKSARSKQRIAEVIDFPDFDEDDADVAPAAPVSRPRYNPSTKAKIG